MSQVCPIARCELRKRSDQLMCRAHWLMVDRRHREQIWKLYNPASAKQSDEYWLAVREAFRQARLADARTRGVVPTPTQGGPDGK